MERAATTRLGASLAVLIAAVIALAGAELVCRLVIPRLSTTEARRVSEYRDAVALRRDGRLKSVLVLGNSLLAEGVDFPHASKRIADHVALSRLVVENTAYYDWYYGIRRLLGDGARPDFIVLALSPDQLVNLWHRGDYSAWLLMQTADAWSAGQTMGMTNTQSADLVISSMSAFFGMRTNLRKTIIRSIVPGLHGLMPVLTYRAEPVLDPQSVRALAEHRLAALRVGIGAAGARIMLLIPPTNDRIGSELTQSVVAAGRAAGVEVLVPITPGTLPSDSFSDGFHLSRAGAKLFTPRFADEIRRAIERG